MAALLIKQSWIIFGSSMAKNGLRSKNQLTTDLLVKAIHAAGAHEQEWHVVLEHLRSNLAAGVVTLGRHEFVTGCSTVMFEAPDSNGFGEAFAAFAARNPWFLSSEDYASGRVMTGEEIIDNRELRRTDFYRGFLKPRGLLHCLSGVVARHCSSAFIVSAFRDEREAPFGASEKTRLQFLLDHLTLSMESHWRWQEADDLAHALLTLIGHDSNPVILATADAKPIYRNPAANRLLEQRVGLCLEGASLTAASTADQRLLRDAIASVAGDAQARDASALRVITLACAPPETPVMAIIRSAGQVFARDAGIRRGLVLITVRGGHAVHDPTTCPFARRYELTAGQAKVNARIFDGQSLTVIACSLNVSDNTVRSHLKQIFQKTSTHGQMELVHLHASMCGSQF